MPKLLLLLLLQIQRLALGQQCSLQGECSGTSLETEFADGHRQCLEYCKSVTGCEWYTYDSINGFCNVLEDCSKINPDCSTCLSGENECEIPLMCYVKGECSGVFIEHAEDASARGCLERCFHDNPKCKYFSFHSARNVCSLYETCELDETETDVISGERDCYRRKPQDFTKVFLQKYNYTAWIHMPSFHENGDGMACSQPAEYPIEIHSAVAQVINGSISICGGTGTGSPYEIDICFSLHVALNVWVEFPKMDVQRSSARSVVTPDGWWVTGGRYNSSFLSSTSLWSGFDWKVGPDLPSERRDHCLVQVNSSHTFLAGGVNGPYLADAYLFDWTTDLWTELPEMTYEYGISALACTLHQDNTGGMRILTAGGWNNYDLVQSIDLNEPWEWSILPELPTDVTYGIFVQDGDDLILINTYNGNLLRFNESNQSFSLIPGQYLPSEFRAAGNTALAIDDSQLYGCS